MKYPTGSRTNRATDSGHWKATGKDKEIHRRRNLIGDEEDSGLLQRQVATKVRRLTGSCMHEYRLEGNSVEHRASQKQSKPSQKNNSIMLPLSLSSNANRQPSNLKPRRFASPRRQFGAVAGELWPWQ
ncbi:hypothetical protein BHM03_00024776 [Ensete ventricosum]|nr:hypothetical protein BHM03_00024776 [Ensete ventricosum]